MKRGGSIVSIDRANRAGEGETRDEGRLADLGYKQELQREWSVIHNFGVSFSIIVSDCRPLSSPESR